MAIPHDKALKTDVLTWDDGKERVCVLIMSRSGLHTNEHERNEALQDPK